MELEEVPYIIGKVLEYDIDYVISSFIWTTFDINRNHFQQIVLMPIQLEPATSLIFHLFSTSLPRVEPWSAGTMFELLYFKLIFVLFPWELEEVPYTNERSQKETYN